MIKTKYLREHGCIYDLIQSFAFAFNNQDMPSSERRPSEDKHRETMTQYFSPVSPDLLLFFYIKKDGTCFILSEFFELNREQSSDIEKFKADSFYTYLSDKNRLLSRLYSFYMNAENPSETYSITDIVAGLNKLSYSNELKYNIISFFTNADAFIDKLIIELKTKEIFLRKYYEENEQQFKELVSGLNAEAIIKEYKCNEGELEISDNSFLYGIPCLVDTSVVKFIFFDDLLILIIGSGYKETLESLATKNRIPAIDLFGKIISDVNRLSILNLLLENEELYTSDIAKMLGISIKVLYYHLEMMVDSGIIKCRNEGRTLYYFLNHDYFKLAVKELKKYEAPLEKNEAMKN